MKMTKYQQDFFINNPDVVWPLCKCGCGEKVVLNLSEPNQVFRTYATASCSRKSKTVPQAALIKLSDREWMFDQRIIQRKSKELIAEELGVSITPVNKWIKSHELPAVRYNQSAASVADVLNNKILLESDYQNGHTISKLASLYGTSTATLSRFFDKHNIQTRPTNSYPRKGKISKQEQSVVDWIRSISKEEVIQSDRSILGTKELDIYIPSRRLAIEYNGVYSHIYRPDEKTDSMIKGPKYHLDKTERSHDKGVNLIHIFSDQWLSRREAVETLLASKLGCNTKIHARKCIVKIPSVHEKNAFLNKYHIQGACKSSIHYGLYHNDILVCLMTFGKPRFTKKYQWELIRFAGHKGITVVGGFSKLIAKFRSANSGTIVSYADRSYSKGDVYSKNGFDLVSTNKPSYHYVNMNTGTRINRTTYTKKRLLQMMGINHSDKSESEITKDLGLERIYDCGTLTFVML